MYDIAPNLLQFDIIEPASMGDIGLKFVSDMNKGSKSTGEPLGAVISDYYLTDVIARRYDLENLSLIRVLLLWHGVVQPTPNEIPKFNLKKRYKSFA